MKNLYFHVRTRVRIYIVDCNKRILSDKNLKNAIDYVLNGRENTHIYTRENSHVAIIFHVDILE